MGAIISMGTRGNLLGDLECGGDLNIVADGNNVSKCDCFYTPHGRSTKPPNPADGPGIKAYPTVVVEVATTQTLRSANA